jgi:subtilisin family serine protease
VDVIELIVKYNGNIDYIANDLDILIEKLSYGYAIIFLKLDDIEKLKNYSEIEYIEEPRRLYFFVNEAKAVSCINIVQNYNNSNLGYKEEGLTGEGVYVAIIDSGIDYGHMDFRNEDGSSRIYRLWDQTVEGTPPSGFILGTEYTNEQINEALKYDDYEIRQSIVRSEDISGHGTHVAGIACGNGRQSNGIYSGVAIKSELIVVKIGDSVGNAYPLTTRLMEALEYVLGIAIKERKPIAINLSFGGF